MADKLNDDADNLKGMFVMKDQHWEKRFWFVCDGMHRTAALQILCNENKEKAEYSTIKKLRVIIKLDNQVACKLAR